MNTLDPLKDPRFEQLVTRLRSQTVPPPAADFTERTLERLRGRPLRRRNLTAVALRAAAALAVLVGTGLWWVRPPMPVATTSAPLNILMAAQRPDGSWAADGQYPGHRYDTSVTALALLALIHASPNVPEGLRADAIRGGLAHLMRQQNPEGRFGPDFSGSGFTHYLATMALQAGLRLGIAEPGWQPAAERAALHLPANVQMAKLNHHLAHPQEFPLRWVDAGGPAAQVAIQILKNNSEHWRL